MTRTAQACVLAAFIGLLAGVLAGAIYKEWAMGFLHGFGIACMVLPGCLMLRQKPYEWKYREFESGAKDKTMDSIMDTDYL